MDSASRIVVAMAEECRVLIETSTHVDSSLPKSMQAEHLLWMSRQISEQADEWPVTKLHRWIGYVQCGMVANRLLDFDGAKAIFRKVRKASDGSGMDQDLIDHLDPEHAFRLDIGGES